MPFPYYILMRYYLNTIQYTAKICRHCLELRLEVGKRRVDLQPTDSFFDFVPTDWLGLTSREDLALS
jgi:hypothetical protein